MRILGTLVQASQDVRPPRSRYSGTADREIAKDLGARFPNVIDYGTARAWIRANGQFTQRGNRSLSCLFRGHLG